MRRLIALLIFTALVISGCGGDDEKSASADSELATCLEGEGLAVEGESTEGVEVVSGVTPTQKLSVSDPESSGSITLVYTFDDPKDAGAASTAEGAEREGLVIWLYPSLGAEAPSQITDALHSCARATA